MVAATLLILHFCAAVYAFLKYKRESLTEGLLAVGLMLIVFAVGWTISSLITNSIFSIEAFHQWYYRPLESSFWVSVRREFNSDTISLLILSLGELIFYYVIFFPSKKQSS
ncbi:MAG: hypothetical protein N3A63_03890 [Bacteroidetes bacterium]|nr:hypothetical protein [Bacteroidota bacterium]